MFYFFERMKGQKKAAEMQRLTAQEKNALEMYPKSLTFSKLEFARCGIRIPYFHVSASVLKSSLSLSRTILNHGYLPNRLL